MHKKGIVMNKLKVSFFAILSLSMVGCSAMNTAMKKQDLDVESKTSYSIVLEPIALEERVVYARVKDLSGNSMRKEMQKILNKTLIDEGITVTSDPKKANLMLNASIISASKTTREESERALIGGYSGGLEGALALGGIAAATGGDGGNIASLGLAGAAVGFLADTLIDDVYYTFILDVQLREKPLNGDSIANSTKNQSAKGLSTSNSATLSQNSSSVTRGDNFNWIVYETRIVTTANQMNLDIKEAIPEVQNKTASTLAEFML